MKFELKSVAGKSMLFVMAAEAEYGPFLRSRIEPLMTGVGPVEAAVALTKTLARLDAADDLPDLVVSLGSAGSAKLEQTEVYQVSSVSYRDMDARRSASKRAGRRFSTCPRRSSCRCASPAFPRQAFPPAATSFRVPPMATSTPTWSTWRPMRCCAPAKATSCR